MANILAYIVVPRASSTELHEEKDNLLVAEPEQMQEHQSERKKIVTST
jgi:hypothetical protein